MERIKRYLAFPFLCAVCTLGALIFLNQATKGASTSQIEDQIPSPAQQQEIVGYGNTPQKDFEADAPWMVDSLTKEIPITVHIKDADLNALTLKSIRIYESATGLEMAIRDDVPYDPEDFVIDDPLFVYVFPGLTAVDFGAEVGGTIDIRVEVYFLDDLGDETYSKRLKIFVSEPMPHLSNWYAGDTHFHSDFTDDPYEWGSGLLKGPLYSGPAIVSLMGWAMGLDWATVTDHSCDFVDAYQWFEMAQLCRDESGSRLTIIPAEEVTSSHEELPVEMRVHILAYDTNAYIEGPEEAGTNQTGILCDINETLEWIQDSNYGQGFSYGAHPFNDAESIVGELLEAYWYDSAYQTALGFSSFRGFEFWNTRKTKNEKQDYIANGLDPFPWEK